MPEQEGRDPLDCDAMAADEMPRRRANPSVNPSKAGVGREGFPHHERDLVTVLSIPGTRNPGTLPRPQVQPCKLGFGRAAPPLSCDALRPRISTRGEEPPTGPR
jgi:hypothetical protein